MPGMKGESGKKPSMNTSEGAYKYSDNSMGDVQTDNIQGWNSMDGSKSKRGGEITNSNGQYGGMKKSSGNSDY
ncbi:MAG: hypothetical protein ACR2QH_15345 [Geminicoccaceae bacterium]